VETAAFPLWQLATAAFTCRVAWEKNPQISANYTVPWYGNLFVEIAEIIITQQKDE
jgi:hypothetical protein